MKSCSVLSENFARELHRPLAIAAIDLFRMSIAAISIAAISFSTQDIT